MILFRTVLAAFFLLFFLGALSQQFSIIPAPKDSINSFIQDPTHSDPSIFIKDNGITSELHKNNIGRITFMSARLPINEYKESDFLSSFDLKKNTDLNIRVFLETSLTNSLHKLAPELSPEELTSAGNYQFSFYVDGKLIYTENLNPGAGSKENKNVLTVFRVPFISSSYEDSWGRFLWQRFMYKGGEDALTEGTHLLKIEIRPYINPGEIKTGDIIAEGDLNMIVEYPEIPVEQKAVQLIKPGSGWEVSEEKFDKMLIEELNTKIAQNHFKDITSIVVIKNGKLLIEEYFNGAARDTLHDTRSVGKSFASAILGIALLDGYIKNEDLTLGEFYNLKNYKNYSLMKEKVTLKSLLTMSSGFKANDFDQDSPGNEENMYPTDNWVKFALDLPMDTTKTVGKHWDYFTAGVVLLGDIMNKILPEGLEKYAEKRLFRRLGIENYKWEYTPQGVANTAGGLRLRSLDYAKFGQLYKNSGAWNGGYLIHENWVNESLSKTFQIPGSENDFYSYLFWNTTYTVNNNKYETSFSSGNGGNKIFIFKDEPLVIVITSTAFGKPYGHSQVNKIMEKYILPAVLK